MLDVLTCLLMTCKQQLELEDTKKLAANLERITTDYQQMKAENSSLIGKLKQQQTSTASS